MLRSALARKPVASSADEGTAAQPARISLSESFVAAAPRQRRSTALMDVQKTVTVIPQQQASLQVTLQSVF